MSQALLTIMSCQTQLQVLSGYVSLLELPHGLCTSFICFLIKDLHRVEQTLLLFHHHWTEEYFCLLSLKFPLGCRTRLLMLCISLSLFWLIRQQFWCQTYLNIESSAASSVSSSWRVSSDIALPAAWISHNKVITHVTLHDSHQRVQSFNFHQVWQKSTVHMPQ